MKVTELHEVCRLTLRRMHPNFFQIQASLPFLEEGKFNTYFLVLQFAFLVSNEDQ
jgi:hypothetical protein